jgi:hypothetical protein
MVVLHKSLQNHILHTGEYMRTSTDSFLCYLGLTIVNKEVLARVHSYKEKCTGQENTKKLKEVHITLIPPFFTTYEIASAINVGCMASTLQSNSIINATRFSLQSLDIMKFEGETIVHFPVKTHTKEKGDNDHSFAERVNALRRQIQELGGELRLPVPNTYTPHISVSINGIHNRLKDVAMKSKEDEILYFKASYPTLYAKYPGIGYRDLTSNPCR